MMENIDEQLKNKIMRRIYIQFFIRKIFSPLLVKLYVMVSFLSFIVANISVGNVVANSPSIFDVNSVYNFSLSAFINTEFIIQILSVGVLMVIILLAKDTVRIYSSSSLTVYSYLQK